MRILQVIWDYWYCLKSLCIIFCFLKGNWGTHPFASSFSRTTSIFYTSNAKYRHILNARMYSPRSYEEISQYKWLDFPSLSPNAQNPQPYNQAHRFDHKMIPFCNFGTTIKLPKMTSWQSPKTSIFACRILERNPKF